MDSKAREYLAEIGRRGGRVSRRALTEDQARRMVKVREARRAYQRFFTRCFWSSDPNYLVTEKDVPWVASRLMEFGGREGWELGAKLCR